MDIPLPLFIATTVEAVDSGGISVAAEDSTTLIDDPGSWLQWVHAPNQRMNWDQANAYAQNLRLAGGGWRMPTRTELHSLYQTPPLAVPQSLALNRNGFVLQN